MTEKDIIAMLKDIRAAKKIEPEIKAQLSYMIEECALIEPLPGRARSPSAEQVLVICEERQEAYARLLLRIRGNEQILSDAIEQLSYDEQRIIKEFYIRCLSIKRLAFEVGYSVDGVKKAKRRAIKKMAESISRCST